MRRMNMRLFLVALVVNACIVQARATLLDKIGDKVDDIKDKVTGQDDKPKEGEKEGEKEDKKEGKCVSNQLVSCSSLARSSSNNSDELPRNPS